MKAALVTGSTGFLGPFVVAALQGADWNVRLAVRKASPAPAAGEAVVGSIAGATDWREALQGTSAVVHLAGIAQRKPSTEPSERAELAEVNTRATLSLAQAAEEMGVRDFVFVSTIFVSGPTTDGRTPFSEDDPMQPDSVYAESKAAAEAGLRDMRPGQMAITVIRPPMIYGRGARANFALLAKAVRSGIPLPFGSVRNRRAFVAAENVADFIRFRLATPNRGLETFNVADDEQVSTPEFIRRIGSSLGRKPTLLPVPPAMLRAGLRAMGRASLAESTMSSLEVDTTRAASAGWTPPLSLDEGLARALQDWRAT